MPDDFISFRGIDDVLDHPMPSSVLTEATGPWPSVGISSR